LADDGAKALELCKHESFALIFMDIQMPVMDGISTLKAIKNNTCNNKTPIIAVTAHALNGEKEKMQQQGFNAYMTKPIDETMLSHIIYEYCDFDNFVGLDDDNCLAQLTVQEDVNAPVTIDWSLALERTGGKVTLAKEMLTGLVDSLASNQHSIRQALIAEDTKQLKRLIHKLNGSCCYTGVPNLSNICQQLETQLKRNVALDHLEPEFFELFEHIEQVLAAAPKILEKADENIP